MICRIAEALVQYRLVLPCHEEVYVLVLSDRLADGSSILTIEMQVGACEQPFDEKIA
jgi:hypothetical protein